MHHLLRDQPNLLSYVTIEGLSRGRVVSLKTPAVFAPHLGNLFRRCVRLYGGVGAAGIVFVRRIEFCESLRAELRQLGISAAVYHAQLSSAAKARNLATWTSGDTTVMIATSAFSMGVDNLRCRFTVHIGGSSSVESFPQECGRAGRGGATAGNFIVSDDEYKYFSMCELLSRSDSVADVVALNDYLLQYVHRQRYTCQHYLLNTYYRGTPPDEQAAEYTCVDKCGTCADRGLPPPYEDVSPHVGRYLADTSLVPWHRRNSLLTVCMTLAAVTNKFGFENGFSRFPSFGALARERSVQDLVILCGHAVLSNRLGIVKLIGADNRLVGTEIRVL